MRISTAILFCGCLLAATPVMAGNLTFDNGQTAWHSTQCPKPKAPQAFSRDPETPADRLSGQMAAHNDYVTALQNYMNCVAGEAQRDQSVVGQAITTGAQAEIAKAQQAASTGVPMREAPEAYTAPATSSSPMRGGMMMQDGAKGMMMMDGPTRGGMMMQPGGSSSTLTPMPMNDPQPMQD